MGSGILTAGGSGNHVEWCCGLGQEANDTGIIGTAERNLK